MQELHIDRWCDMCWLDGERRVPAEHSYAAGIVESTVHAPAVKLLEVCDQHAKDVADLASVLQKVQGFKADTPPPAKKPKGKDGPPSAQPTPCDICGGELTRSLLPAHIWSQHCSRDRPPHPQVCPECGSVDFPSARSMAVHRSSHGFSALDEAYAAAARWPFPPPPPPPARTPTRHPRRRPSAAAPPAEAAADELPLASAE